MRLARFALPWLLFIGSSFAQTTYTSIKANVNIGEPERVVFVFQPPAGQTGDTQLVVQCDFQRAWLITNFYTLQQQSSNVFPITCTSTGRKSYVLNSTPLLENLTMTDGSQLALTIQSANWALVPWVKGLCDPNRWGCPVGSAQITY